MPTKDDVYEFIEENEPVTAEDILAHFDGRCPESVVIADAEQAPRRPMTPVRRCHRL